MTKEELAERRNKLLHGRDLYNAIDRMIRLKDLPATCRSVTSISGRDGRGEIVIELYVDIANTLNTAIVYLYITEDIFDKFSFKYTDMRIGSKSREISEKDLDKLIQLRALRTVFNVIKEVNNKSMIMLHYDRPIYVRTLQTGYCTYDN